MAHGQYCYLEYMDWHTSYPIDDPSHCVRVFRVASHFSKKNSDPVCDRLCGKFPQLKGL